MAVAVYITAGAIVLAAVAAALVWANGHALPGSVVSALCWETLVLAWLVLLGVATLHEFAHGLTCKRYGGEVHEDGRVATFRRGVTRYPLPGTAVLAVSTADMNAIFSAGDVPNIEIGTVHPTRSTRASLLPERCVASMAFSTRLRNTCTS